MAKQNTLSVGELSRRSGIAVSALHFYENRGLIRSSRNSSNHRRYGRSVLRKLSVIKAAQRAGLSLEEIGKAFATLPDGDKISTRDWASLSTEWRAQLEDRIARLSLLRDSLNFCIGCGCLSEKYCEMLNPGDKLSALGPGPQLLEPGNEHLAKRPAEKPD